MKNHVKTALSKNFKIQPAICLKPVLENNPFFNHIEDKSFNMPLGQVQILFIREHSGASFPRPDINSMLNLINSARFPS